MSFKRKKHNPIDIISYMWPDADISHISYDPEMTIGDYNIIRQSEGDGTLFSTQKLLWDGLINIVDGSSYYIKTEPDDWSKLKHIKYTVGKIKHVTVYGMVQLKCSRNNKYPGLRERIRIPVKCEYVY